MMADADNDDARDYDASGEHDEAVDYGNRGHDYDDDSDSDSGGSDDDDEYVVLG